MTGQSDEAASIYQCPVCGPCLVLVGQEDEFGDEAGDVIVHRSIDHNGIILK